MRIESCTEGRSQTAAHLISEYRRGLFPFWGDILGVFFVCLVKIYDWIFVKHYQYTGAVLPRDIKFKLPDVRFMRDDISSPEIIKRADVVWIQTNCIGHKSYNIIIDLARKYNRRVRYFAYPRIRTTLDFIVQKEKDGDLPPAIDKMQIKRLLTHPEEHCPICDGKIDAAARLRLEQLLEKIAVSSETSNYLKEIKGSLEMYIDQTAQFKEKLDELRQTEMDLEAQKEKIEKRLKEIAGSLSNYDSNETQGKINIAATESKRAKVISQIKLAYQNESAAEATIRLCESAIEEINKKQLDAIKKIKEYDDIRYEMEIIQKLHAYFKHFQSDIMERMKNEIQSIT